MDQARYSISQIASAADVPVNTIRSWFHREHLRLQGPDKKASTNGLAHCLSLRSALRIGAMAALVRHGIEPARAGQAALMWTDNGGAKFGEPYREPAELYADPYTVLCCYSDGLTIVKHMPRSRSAEDIFVATSSFQPTVTAIVLDHVDKRVRSGLEAEA